MDTDTILDEFRQSLTNSELRRLERALTEMKEAGAREAIEECIKLSDRIESQEPDGGTRQWMAFKAFRNSMRDKLQTLNLTNKDI